MEFSALKHEFGELESYDNRFVDIIVTNHGPKQGYILSVRKPMEVVYIQSNALVDKDSSLVLRFQVNPREKGRFSYDVQIFTSDKGEASILKLTGTMNEISQSTTSYLTACPDFNSHPIGKKTNEFDLTVITIDAESRSELSKTNVSMIQNGRAIWSKKTDERGKIKEDATIGLSYFYATHEGYLPAEKGAFVSIERNVIVIELRKDPVYAQPVPVPEELIVEIDSIPSEQITILLEEELQNDVVTTTEIDIPPTLEELDDDNFDPTLFDPVNVAFVLDVSSSMNQGDKMELMKYSLNQLAGMLREEDHISIVTYSSNAHVLLPPTSGANKDEIYAQVERLRASGMTAGGEGIKLGFKEASDGFITDGVNHVFVITDGAFNRSSDDYKKYVKKYSKLGIKMSVVGILNAEKDEVEMRDAAEIGGGIYIPIFKLVDAQHNLKQAIRIMSFSK